MDKLTLLQSELNMHSLPDGRKAQLEQLLTIAASQLEQKGIHLKEGVTKDDYLQVEYAAWLWRRRSQTDTAAMPRYLQVDIHDRLVSEKATVTDGKE